ncbi:MAG: hypothetical protein KGZ69_07070 [Methylomonas sp.]|nr:hypothetical protein [Methylomonas sp.]
MSVMVVNFNLGRIAQNRVNGRFGNNGIGFYETSSAARLFNPMRESYTDQVTAL